jgi:hypothetical protein
MTTVCGPRKRGKVEMPRVGVSNDAVAVDEVSDIVFGEWFAKVDCCGIVLLFFCSGTLSFILRTWIVCSSVRDDVMIGNILKDRVLLNITIIG